MAKGTRLLKRDTSQPEIGSPINEPIGKANKMVPKAASLKSNVDLIVGILDAQVEKLRPDIKKNRLKKILCLFLVIMYCDWTAKVTKYLIFTRTHLFFKEIVLTRGQY